LWNGKCHIAGAISRYINDSPVGQLAVIMDPDVKLYNESERLSIPGKAGRTRRSPTISSEILEKVTRLIYYIVSEGPSHEHHRIGSKNRVAGNQSADEIPEKNRGGDTMQDSPTSFLSELRSTYHRLRRAIFRRSDVCCQT
jgi:hypothetical protein